MTTEQLKSALAICPIDCEIFIANQEDGTVRQLKGAMPVPFPGKPAFILQSGEPQTSEKKE